MHLIIYGPEGSGKGTQAKLISENFDLPIITSGDLVREKAVNDKGVIGQACKTALTSGTYVSDNIMFDLWGEKLGSKSVKKGFVLDGFPRNENQAHFLLKEVEKSGYSIDYFIYLQLSDQKAVERLIKRKRKLFKGSKVSHDSPERIHKRLELYRKMERKLVKLFKDMNILFKVNGDQSVEGVFKEVARKLKKT